MKGRDRDLERYGSGVRKRSTVHERGGPFVHDKEDGPYEKKVEDENPQLSLLRRRSFGRDWGDQTQITKRTEGASSRDSRVWQR